MDQLGNDSRRLLSGMNVTETLGRNDGKEEEERGRREATSAVVSQWQLQYHQ